MTYFANIKLKSFPAISGKKVEDLLRSKECLFLSNMMLSAEPKRLEEPEGSFARDLFLEDQR